MLHSHSLFLQGSAPV